MKRILLSFVILLSAALSMAQMPILPGILNAQSAGGGATNIIIDASVTPCHGDSSSGPTVTCSLTSIAAGDLLVCQWALGTFDGNGRGAAITDSLNAPSGFYSAMYEEPTNVTADGIQYFPNSAAGSDTITLQSGSTSDYGVGLYCAAYVNARATAVLDSALWLYKLQGSNLANPTAGTATSPTANGELISGLLDPASGTPTAGSGYTLGSSLAVGGSIKVWPEYVTQTTKSSTNCPYTLASTTWDDLCVAFLPSSASAGVTPPLFYTNFSGGSSGSAPTAAQLNASTFGSPCNWDVSNSGSSLTLTSAAGPTNSLGSSVWVQGASYSGSGGLNLQYATGTGGDTITCTLSQLFSGTLGFPQVWLTYQYESTVPQNDTNSNQYDMDRIASADGTMVIGATTVANGTALYLEQQCEINGDGASSTGNNGSPVSLPHQGAIPIATSTVYSIALFGRTDAVAGTVNTQNSATGGCSSDCVTWVSGPTFPATMSNMYVAGTLYAVSSVQSSTVATLTTAPGTQSAAVYSLAGYCAGGAGCDLVHVYTVGTNTDISGSPVGCYNEPGSHLWNSVELGTPGAEAQTGGYDKWQRNPQVSVTNTQPTS